jgi:predicted PurR-regulated permease PerM
MILPNNNTQPVDGDDAVPATGAAASTAEEPGVILHSPVSVRSASLLVIAVLASLTALHLAKVVFVPLVVGLMLSTALTPLVNQMVRVHIPRILAAAMLLLGIVGGTGTIGYSLSDDAVALIEALPEVVQKLSHALNPKSAKGPAGAMEKVQKAATEIERTAAEGNKALEPERDVAKVQIEQPKVNVKNYLWPGALGLAGVAAHTTVILFVAFFLLAEGDNFRRKMVKIAGPTLTRKKLTLQALNEIDQKIQRYLLVQVFTSAVVGCATWLAFLWIGVEHAAVWGVVTFVFNFIPYVGSVVASGAAMLVGFAQFGSFEIAFLIGGVELLINVVEAYILTPWLTSRASRMNPVAVFAGVLAWGWLWGIWGLFLGVPILVVIKVVCDRVDEFKSVGELLGE